MALFADDQLRQRMAWALSQILVISPSLLADPFNTEATLQYYDIFVRNAFGSYRDILKQVAFSPRMGDMLTYIGGESWQFSFDRGNPTFPDENFAREIMQLFSVGVERLNMDGTRQMGENNRPIPTYDTSDILSFAKAWTGFTANSKRGNQEATGRITGPMKLNG
jgi:uncharacterized protein (DUF1800 family)